jgi:hypothetical protein
VSPIFQPASTVIAHTVTKTIKMQQIAKNATMIFCVTIIRVTKTVTTDIITASFIPVNDY